MQVLLDVVLLSRTSMLLHDHSSVALLAALLNPSLPLLPLLPESRGGNAAAENGKQKNEESMTRAIYV